MKDSAYTYQIDPLLRLATHIFVGKFDADQLMECFSKLIDDPNFSPEYNLLTDFREATLTIQPADIERISTHLFGKFKGRSAILVASPQQTAISYLYINKVSELRAIELFSTEKGAMNYLGVGID